MISKTIMALINALQSYKSFSPANPVDISTELHRWELAENYDATEVSIYSAEGEEISEPISKIYTRYSDVREDNGTYYAVDESAWLTALRIIGESQNYYSRIGLLNCLSTYWSDFKWIPEVYDILIVLAESLRYYEEQIPTYTQIASDLMAEAILTSDLASERMR